MKLRWNMIAQLVGIILQLYNQYQSVIPEDFKPVVAAVIGILQGIAALVAHYSNPNGTPAVVAYVPPAKKP